MSEIISRDTLDLLIQASYFLAVLLFILGIKRMSSPVTARRGIRQAGLGMLLAVAVTFFLPDMGNYLLIITALFLGSLLAWISARKVAMTGMPQMVALYNGMGGGAAATIGAVALYAGHDYDLVIMGLAVLGGLIGSIAFSGSLVAYAKLEGLIAKTLRFPGLQVFNALVFFGAIASGIALLAVDGYPFELITLFFTLSLLAGITITMPIGGADMPVVISLYNALTGLAVAFEGFVLDNPAMIIAGIVVGAAGTLLTQLMAKAMNRPLSNVLFAGFGDTGGSGEEGPGGTMKETEASDAAITMAYADKVIIVPGYGLAVAQAQHKLWEFCERLMERGVEVKFAIHPVAGRMPGHMNVLLAEAGVPYDHIFDLEEINSEFDGADVALVIGANDVVNPDARSKKDSPIFGMPILNVDHADNVMVVKRGRGTGFSGVENPLFFADNTQMVFGDAQEVAGHFIQGLKSLDG
ncbi:NAD(P) transhydrogenase subunit beta [Natronospira proteinivora]|uniref:NAD(P) transhydrogenase subunit beta n=1 Tax=Natronospira proteinivora TaxID=1807133 RepID=A0ABT1GA07_9GAMM|nr:NAD(P) transhydrogenase subunit beta [Natronospira proteinivora]